MKATPKSRGLVDFLLSPPHGIQDDTELTKEERLVLLGAQSKGAGRAQDNEAAVPCKRSLLPKSDTTPKAQEHKLGLKVKQPQQPQRGITCTTSPTVMQIQTPEPTSDPTTSVNSQRHGVCLRHAGAFAGFAGASSKLLGLDSELRVQEFELSKSNQQS